MGTILRKPWLLDYLLGVAREFGGEPAPLSEQKRLVQIVKFITGPTERNPNPFEIWTEVSDGTHFIPARLSSAAVDRHLKDHGERISACKTGYFSIKQYRPFLTHVPTGVNDEIESMARLALEIESVGLIGSKGEPPFGDLTLVTAEERMRRWTGGLLKDQGDILKKDYLRQQQFDKKEPAPQETSPFVDNPPLKTPSDTKLNVVGFKQPSAELWKFFARDPLRNAVPSEKDRALLDKITVFGQEKLPSPVVKHEQIELPVKTEELENGGSSRAPPESPERILDVEWEPTPSPKGRAQRMSPAPSPLKQHNSQSQKPMSSQSIPTTALPDTYEVQTNPLFHDNSSLPASSLPFSSLSPFRGQITQESVPLRGNVLVPDSDVSGSQSQSVSGSQSIPYDASQSRLSVTGFGGPSHPSPEPRANKENQFTKSPTHKTSEATKETPESANEKSHRSSPTLSVTKQTDVAHPNSPPNPPQTAEPVPSLGLAQAISETYRGIEDGSYDLIPETREQDEAVIEVIRPRSPIKAAKRKRDHATSSSEDETPPKKKKSDIVDPVRPVEHSPPSWRSPAFLQKSRKSVAKDDILVQRQQTSEPDQKDLLQSSRTSGSSLGKLDLPTNPSPPLVSSSGTKISKPSADRDQSQNTEAPLSTLKEPPGSASNGNLEKHEIHGDQQAQLSNRMEELRSEAHVERASSPEIPQPPDLDRRYTAHEKGKMKAIPSPEQKDDAVVPPEPARSAKSKPVIDAGLFARFHPGNGLDISAHADEAGIRLMNWRDLDGILTKTREAKAHANYS